MKKYYILLILATFAIKSTLAQNRYKTAQLAALAKTWGHLKYYHPEIAVGRHNWDSVLISAIQNILVSKKSGQVKAELGQLFKIAGQNTAPERIAQNMLPISLKNYDHSWIRQSRILSPQQKQLLIFNTKHPYGGPNFYARANPDNDSTVFTPNEKPYKEMLYPDANYRLLSLFRFWNVINYYYPYKYAIGKSWGSVLEEMIPVMINATDTLSYHKALAKMSASINYSHGGLWPSVFTSFTGKYSPPFNFTLIDGKAVVTKIVDSLLCKGSGIRVGSVISSIDQTSVKSRIKANLDFVPASNYGGKLKTMLSFILNSHVPQALYAFQNPDGIKVVATIKQVERNFLKEYTDFMKMTSLVTAKVMEGNIGYIYFSNINGKNLDSAMNALRNTRSIIFDMRNYPTNGYGTYYLPDYFLSQPQIYARNTYPDFTFPGIFKYKVANDDTDVSRVGKNNPKPYQGKIILLVDYRTQSAAEWACMTLMTAPDVTVIGNQTAGADGNVTRTILPGNYKINFSGLGIYFPNGAETQRKGIPIDIEVHDTLKDVIHDDDPVLKRAIEFVKQQK
ncbi:S41 family peptidase [Pedobacter sp. KLB.chiD]|uniref:S41 family peptidase n=1 Tax=Pedobacter sp. KLB.chiD TaxID=3387402 RepID=UPI00399C02F4